jgi:hypothetical protein
MLFLIVAVAAPNLKSQPPLLYGDASQPRLRVVDEAATRVIEYDVISSAPELESVSIALEG